MNTRELEKLFKAVANKRRIAIIKYLKRRRETSVFEVADEVDLSFKAASKHLVILLAAGILEREQKGFRAVFRIAGELSPEVRTVLSLIIA